MTIDFTGGLDASREYVFPECPDEPGMRDAVNMWVSDDRGAVGLPRFAVEAVAPGWDRHDVQVNVAFPDGRVFRVREAYPSLPTTGPDGKASMFGAGPLVFRCVEPFRVWTASFEGEAVETSSNALIAGKPQGPSVKLGFTVEATMAVPPWIQGTLFPDAAEMLENSIEGQFMGGPRHEQLFRASGTVRIGTQEHAFKGSGLRIRRQGIRNVTEFWGHAWQSALFPSGRAFGYIAYPPRPDGSASYNEGFLFAGDGELIPAKVVQAPWLQRLRPRGDDVSLVLESRLGTTRIEGETVLSTFELGHPEMPRFPMLFQGGVRYRWDGEETYGMLERSSRRDKIVWDRINGFDHVSLPMRNTEAMVAFYRSLGLQIAENPHVVSVYAGNQMINFHRPTMWQRQDFTLRAPAAEPPCGDLCVVWDGSPQSLKALLDGAGAKIIEGPVERHGGRRAAASSVYVRDPDGNLLEFMIY